MADKEDPIKNEIKCECGENCKMGLIISEIGDKIKVQIFDNRNIMSVIVNKEKMLEKLK